MSLSDAKTMYVNKKGFEIMNKKNFGGYYNCDNTW